MIFEPSAKLQRMLAWSDKLNAEYAGTFCELFKTKGYMRTQKVRYQLVLRIIKQITEDAGLTCKFNVEAQQPTRRQSATGTRRQNDPNHKTSTTARQSSCTCSALQSST